MNDFVYLVRFLYQSLRHRLFLWLLLVAVATVLEGLTIGMFLPVIAAQDSESPLAGLLTNAFDTANIQYELPFVLSTMVVIYLVRTGFLVLQEVYGARLTTGLLVRLKVELIKRIFRVDYQYYTEKGIAYFTNAATLEFNNLAQGFDYCTRFAISLAFVIVYIALALAIDPILSAAILVIGIPGYFALKQSFQVSRRAAIRLTETNAQLQSYVMQALGSFKYLKATASDPGIAGLAASTASEQGQLMYQLVRIRSIVNKGIDLTFALLIVGLLFYSVEINGADLVAIVFVLFILRRAVGYFQSIEYSFRRTQEFAGSIRLLRALRDDVIEHDETPHLGTVTPNLDRAIKFNCVSFGYNGASHVLKGLNLVIPPKRIIAFVGPSGSGKSTLVSLITGILRPTSGDITIGEVSYDRIDKTALRQGIGFVTQENVIFDDTVYNNVTLWSDDDHSESQVRRASQLASASDFIAELPDQYATVLGDNGVRLSGGQRQRISVARELYKDAKILILDEATSALDTALEQEIQRNIDGFRGEKTVIMIAHRLSTVKSCDVIVVIDDGRVVEQGTYNYLYGLGGVFTSMVNNQTLSDSNR